MRAAPGFAVESVRAAGPVRLVLIALAMMLVVLVQPGLWLGAGQVRAADLTRGMAIWDLRPFNGTRAPDPAFDEVASGWIQSTLTVELPPARSLLLVVDPAPETFVHVNGVRLSPVEGRSGAERYDIPAHYRVSGPDRIEIVHPVRTGGVHFPRLVLSTDPAAIRRAEFHSEWLARLRFASGIAGLLISAAVLAAIAARQSRESAAMALLPALLGSAAAPGVVAGLLPESYAFFSWLGLAAAIAGGLVIWSGNRRLQLGADLQTVAGFAALLLAASMVYTLIFPAFSAIPSAISAAGLALTVLYQAGSAVRFIRATIRKAGNIWSRLRHREYLIRDQQATISRQAETLEAEIRRRAILEERARLSRDIHDGLGGMLMSLLVQVRTGSVPSERLAESIESGIGELRLMIDSLDHAEHSLTGALATFQTRIRPVFQTEGITLDWNLPAKPLPEAVAPEVLLSLFRVLQEASTNILRHSGAATAVFRFDWNEDARLFSMHISDDGCGYDPESVMRPGGTRNMAHRIVDMGGDFDAGPGEDGRGCIIRASVTL